MQDMAGNRLANMTQERPWTESHTKVHIISWDFDSRNNTADLRMDPRVLVLFAALHFGEQAVSGSIVLDALACGLVCSCCCLAGVKCLRRTTDARGDMPKVEHMTLIDPEQDGYDSGTERDRARCLNCCTAMKPQCQPALPMAPVQ